MRQMSLLSQVRIISLSFSLSLSFFLSFSLSLSAGFDMSFRACYLKHSHMRNGAQLPRVRTQPKFLNKIHLFVAPFFFFALFLRILYSYFFKTVQSLFISPLFSFLTCPSVSCLFHSFLSSSFSLHLPLFHYLYPLTLPSRSPCFVFLFSLTFMLITFQSIRCSTLA